MFVLVLVLLLLRPRLEVQILLAHPYAAFGFAQRVMRERKDGKQIDETSKGIDTAR